jgi:hypothetical protein
MFWAAVMLTLPQILSWFSGFGMNVPISAGGGTAFLNVFKVDVTNFVNQFVVGYFAPVMAAWLVLRGVIDVAEGRNPLYSILGAMFLLSIASTQLAPRVEFGTKFARLTCSPACGRTRRAVFFRSPPAWRLLAPF